MNEEVITEPIKQGVKTKFSISKKNLVEIYLKGHEEGKSDAQIAREIGMNYQTYKARTKASNFLSVLQVQKSIDKKDFSNIFTDYFARFEQTADNYLKLSNDIMKSSIASGEKEKALKILYALHEKQKDMIELLIRIQEAHQHERDEKEHTIYFGCKDCPKLKGIEEVKEPETDNEDTRIC